MNHREGISHALIERTGCPVEPQFIGLHPHASGHLANQRMAILVDNDVDVVTEVVPIVRDTEAQISDAIAIKVTKERIGERKIGEDLNRFIETKSKARVRPMGELM